MTYDFTAFSYSDLVNLPFHHQGDVAFLAAVAAELDRRKGKRPPTVMPQPRASAAPTPFPRSDDDDGDDDVDPVDMQPGDERKLPGGSVIRRSKYGYELTLPEQK
jgi:hypothetical protein